MKETVSLRIPLQAKYNVGYELCIWKMVTTDEWNVWVIIKSKPYLHQNGLKCIIMDILCPFFNMVVQYGVKSLAIILRNYVNWRKKVCEVNFKFYFWLHRLNNYLKHQAWYPSKAAFNTIKVFWCINVSIMVCPGIFMHFFYFFHAISCLFFKIYQY